MSARNLSQPPIKKQKDWTYLILSVLAVWAAIVGAAGYAGVFVNMPTPLIGVMVVCGIATLLGLYYANPGVRLFIQTLNVKGLTIFHLWRIPAALAIFWYGSQHLLPETFVHRAAWGDLIAGLLVLPVVLTRGGGNAKYLAFHLFGLGDFILAVGTGLTFALLQVPMMDTILTFPMVLIPLFGVCISGASHLMALDLLLRKPMETAGD